jgi:hypothetical protein
MQTRQLNVKNSAPPNENALRVSRQRVYIITELEGYDLGTGTLLRAQSNMACLKLPPNNRQPLGYATPVLNVTKGSKAIVYRSNNLGSISLPQLRVARRYQTPGEKGPSTRVLLRTEVLTPR